MSTRHICPVNFDFEQHIDWQRIRKIYAKIVEKTQQGTFVCHQEPSYGGARYDLGRWGSVIESDCLTPNELWRVWAGPLLEELLPDSVLHYRNIMREHGLNFVNFNYFQHQSNIMPHQDGKRLLEAPNGHCNINLVVSAEDPTAETLAYAEDGSVERYHGTGQWWLLDTTVIHEVRNQGPREIFQLKVFDSYSTVKDFLQSQGWVTA